LARRARQGETADDRKQIADCGFRIADLGFEMRDVKYGLPFTIYDFCDFYDFYDFYGFYYLNGFNGLYALCALHHVEKCEMTEGKFCVRLRQIPATLACLSFQRNIRYSLSLIVGSLHVPHSGVEVTWNSS
jgi:hypothetical protein